VKFRPHLKNFYGLVADAASACIADNVFAQGAALAYYTIFAIAPLFIIALAIAGFCFGEDVARRELFSQLNQLVGAQGGDAIQSLVAAAGKSRAGFWATWIAGGTLAIAATGVFVQLQNSLNLLWRVRAAQGRGLRNFIRHRLLSFAMVLGIGFLLLVSLICSASVAALGHYLGNFFSGTRLLLRGLNFIFSLGLVTVLFTMIFKFLPDVKIAWRDVWLGGLLTALLFTLGKWLIGIYIGRSSLASIYGAMGSLVIVLVWVYYSAQILLFGAQFTCLYARRFGVKPEPLAGVKFFQPEGEDRASNGQTGHIP
jgi:membrane protein